MPRKLSEERTRKEMIDPQLEQVGWYLADRSKVQIEIPVDGYEAEPWNGVGEVFAAVVAQVESLRGRMSEASRQVNGLFESLLSESFGG